jgi:hypothetical protein
MILVKAMLTLKSPAIVATRRVERGYVKPLDYIPGSTLRGALISALYREGLVSASFMEREADKPTILSSPAYPFIKSSPSMPGTPFTARCKICDTIIDITRSVIEKIQESEEFTPPRCQDHGIKSMESMYSQLVVRIDDKLERAEIFSYRSTSVGIDKNRGTFARGMLFDYEAVAEGTVFWARLILPDELDFEKIKRIEVWIGRGISRGFGRAVLELEKSNIGSEAERLHQLIGSESAVLYSLSPLIPQEHLVSDTGDAELNIERVYGRREWIKAGFDVRRAKHRPLIQVVKQGALVKVRLRGDPEKASKFLALLGYGGMSIPVGAEGHVVTGVNVLIPVDDYILLAGGE